MYDPAQEIVLRNRELDGTPGVHILTPLRLSGSDTAVLVDRGWLPRDQAEPAARSAFAAPPGEVLISGIARRSQDESAGGPQDPPLGLDRTRLDAWFHVDTTRIQQQTGYPLLPIFIEQQPAAGRPRAAAPCGHRRSGRRPAHGLCRPVVRVRDHFGGGIYRVYLYRQTRQASAAISKHFSGLSRNHGFYCSRSFFAPAGRKMTDK